MFQKHFFHFVIIYTRSLSGDIIRKILEHCDLWHDPTATDPTATVELIGPNGAGLALMIIASWAWEWMCNVG